MRLRINPGKYKPGDFFASHIKKGEFLQWTMAPINANVVIIESTAVQKCREIGAGFMARGLRPSYDLTQEASLDFWNGQLSDHSVKTLFFMPPDNLNHLSSSVIKDLLRFKLSDNLRGFIDPYVLARWLNGQIPERKLYFGQKCVGKSTYLVEDFMCRDCDELVWEFFSPLEKERLTRSMRSAIEEGNAEQYDNLMGEMSSAIDWYKLLDGRNSYEASALGAYFKYIPPEVIGKFKLVKISTTKAERIKRAKKRGCLDTLARYNLFYKDPPFYDEEVTV